jgi:MFS family permease
MKNLVTPSLLVVMSLLLGLVNSFDAPLRQSLIGRFVGSPADLPNALALNAMLFNTGRFIGPPVAGLLLAFTSEAACFAVNSLSFIALITALLLIKGGTDERATGSIVAVFREGVAYAWKTWEVRMLLTILVGLNVTASCYTVLLPIFAKDVFGGDATTLGWLWGAAGSGSFGSTIFLATRRSLPGLVGSVAFGVLLSAAGLLAFSAASALLPAMASMAVLGFGISVCNVGCNMLLQTVTPTPLRGRIMSFFTSARFGFDAVGGLIAGVLAASLGANRTLLVEGGLLLVFVLFLQARKARLRERIVEAGYQVGSALR